MILNIIIKYQTNRCHDYLPQKYSSWPNYWIVEVKFYLFVPTGKKIAIVFVFCILRVNFSKLFQFQSLMWGRNKQEFLCEKTLLRIIISLFCWEWIGLKKSILIVSAVPKFCEALDIIRIRGPGLTILHAKMFENIYYCIYTWSPGRMPLCLALGTALLIVSTRIWNHLRFVFWFYRFGVIIQRLSDVRRSLSKILVIRVR